jgi:hypothetical protein
LFATLCDREAPECNYIVTVRYYLVDCIYPQLSPTAKTTSKPQGNKITLFAQMQEGARNDVERAFGVLEARWAIVRGPANMWDLETLWETMTACVIMHNMIVEDEGDDIRNVDFEKPGEHVTS